MFPIGTIQVPGSDNVFSKGSIQVLGSDNMLPIGTIQVPGSGFLKSSFCYIRPVEMDKLQANQEQRSSEPRPHMLKRWFASVPEADRKYMPVPKAFRKARNKPVQKGHIARALDVIYKRVPIIEFLKNKVFKKNASADLVAGLAATGLHFPQGLAYAIMAGLPPGLGMVSTILPVLIYMMFGSSPHTSIGTNAIVSIMIGDMLLEPSLKASMLAASEGGIPDVHLVVNNSSETYKGMNATAASYTFSIESSKGYMDQRIALVSGATLYIGIMFFLMAIFRMGFLVTYLSRSFMSGFTTGVAVHIFSSQIALAFGLKLPPSEGLGKLVKLYYNVFAHVSSVHVPDLLVSLICVTILIAVKIGINEKFKLRIPIPIDFILLVVVTIISYFAQLPSKFDVKSIGVVELGFHAPIMPAMFPVGPLLLYALQIALVTFFLNISVVKILARRNGYEINENIELNAYGMCNILPAFLSILPASVAPPRASLLSAMGAKTTMNGVSTFVIMLALVFYFDIPYGLALGVLVSLLSVVNQSQRGWVSILGKSDSEDLYMDSKLCGSIHELPRIKIVRMEASLYFATAEQFRKNIYKIIEQDTDNYDDDTEEDPESEQTNIALTVMNADDKEEEVKIDGETQKLKNGSADHGDDDASDDDSDQFSTKILIIDCIPFNFMDGTGLDMLKLVIF
ncbi:sulfate transporter-like [Dreissena polymorpha]|uniref:sulfate transporter-like n=1 Tax=Dreissena polymorpha TaxID=45954 RepID=UPI00226539A2|nr:sulfate transporter-like [Dreissena polymorpha]